MAYRHWGDTLAVAVGLRDLGIVWPCYVKEGGTGAVVAYGMIPLDQCYKFDRPQRMRGLWRNEFEGSQFCTEPAKECSWPEIDKRSQPVVWLDLAKPLPAELRPARGGGLYAVDFIGRRTSYRGAYGHFGMSDYAVLVDRMISMKELEPPPKRADDETLK